MSSDTLKKVILFLFINILGFGSSTIIFLIGMKLGRFSAVDEATIALVQDKLVLGTTMTWIVCAVFSISYFFFEGRWGKIFLWSAFVFPAVYGLNVLLAAG